MESVYCHYEKAVVKNILVLTNLVFICLKRTNPTNKTPDKSNQRTTKVCGSSKGIGKTGIFYF